VKHPMAFAFRKTKSAVTEAPLPAIPRKTSPLKLIAEFPIASAFKPIVTPSAPLPQPTDLAEIRRLADAGDLRDAVEQCERHVRQSPSSPDPWYLLGVLKEALGDSAGALDCYRKLLYLDPEHAEAMTHLALLTERHGDPEAAARTRERARRIELRRNKTALPLR
jgi:chemotaxis protein methyltransferase WspC